MGGGRRGSATSDGNGLGSESVQSDGTMLAAQARGTAFAALHRRGAECTEAELVNDGASLEAYGSTPVCVRALYWTIQGLDKLIDDTMILL